MSFTLDSTSDSATSSTKPVIIQYYTDPIQDKLDLYLDEYLKSANFTELEEFISIQLENSIQLGNEILPRFAQSIVNRWEVKRQEQMSKLITELFDAFDERSNLPGNELVKSLLEMFSLFLLNESNCNCNQQHQIRNDQQKVAMILSTVDKKYSDLIENPVLRQKLTNSIAQCSSNVCHFLHNNLQMIETSRFEPRFMDTTQDRFNQMVMELESKIESRGNYAKYFDKTFSEQIASLISNQDDFWFRLIESLIELMGSIVSDDRIDVAIGWIASQVQLLSTDSNQSQPTSNELHRLIAPYLRVFPKCSCDSQTATKQQRNLCVVLNILTYQNQNFQFDSQLVDEVTNLLQSIIVKCENKSSLLYALILLGRFVQIKANFGGLNISNRDELIKSLRILSRDVSMFNLNIFYVPFGNYLSYQVGLCAHLLLNHLTAREYYPNEFDLGEIELKSSFDVESNSRLKYSPNRLSVRNDTSDYQTACSLYPVTSGTFYYEVILLTSGSVRIGWINKLGRKSHSAGYSIGDCKHSIAFDGYHRQIRHNNQSNQLMNANVRWHSGDVIGCLVDINRNQFIFFLNGKRIDRREIDSKVDNNIHFSSTVPYFAAVTLSIHQQCYVNFGQSQFKYNALDHVSSGSIKTIHQCIADYVEQSKCPFCLKREANGQFVSCNHWTVCFDCMKSLKKCPNCDSNHF